MRPSLFTFSALCTIFDLKHVQNQEKPSALCTTFNPNHVQNQEKPSALCTTFNPNHVQNAEDFTAENHTIFGIGVVSEAVRLT